MQQMSDWLEKLGMSQYDQRFVDSGVVHSHAPNVKACVGGDCSCVAVSLARRDLAALHLTMRTQGAVP
jgi:hypothetical protein